MVRGVLGWGLFELSVFFCYGGSLREMIFGFSFFFCVTIGWSVGCDWVLVFKSFSFSKVLFRFLSVFLDVVFLLSLGYFWILGFLFEDDILGFIFMYLNNICI